MLIAHLTMHLFEQEYEDLCITVLYMLLSSAVITLKSIIKVFFGPAVQF